MILRKTISQAIFSMVVAITFISNVFALPKDIEIEKESIRLLFNTKDVKNIRKFGNRFYWSGYSDPELYDILEKEFIKNVVVRNYRSIEDASWYAKWLGYSGNLKYKETLTKGLNISRDSSKIKRHVKRGLETLEEFSTFNPIISEGLENAPEGQLFEWRIKNMILSDYPKLIRKGARLLYYQRAYDAELVDVAAEKLESVYKTKHHGEALIAYRWLLKGLLISASPKHKNLVEKMSLDAKGSLKKDAIKALEKHYSSL